MQNRAITGDWLTLAALLSALLFSSCGGAGQAPQPSVNSHVVDLSWTASTSTVAGYYIYRGTTSGGPYTRLNSTLATATTYSDTTVQPGNTYYYVVTSVDSNLVESAYSNEVTAAVPTP
jgi:fibronectin type 3 domain-containing protein